MTSRKRKNPDHQFFYEISITDWSANVTFNEYAYHNIFDLAQFEEKIHMVLKGRLTSTLSKKCKEGLAVKLMLYPGDFWYDPKKIREDAESIGDMEIMKPTNYGEKEETIYFRISVPTKSYENMRAYLSYKGTANVTLAGTELHKRKGEIYYLYFKGHDEMY